MTVVDMTTAVDGAISDGDSVYLAGFTHLIPFAAGHEIIRQGYEELTLVRATPDLVYDQELRLIREELDPDGVYTGDG